MHLAFPAAKEANLITLSIRPINASSSHLLPNETAQPPAYADENDQTS
jgi:hypothetical protein